MYRERKSGLGYSAGFHVLLLILAIFGLPSFFKSEPPPEPAAITVEILPITGITNVKPSDTAPSEQPKPEPKAAPTPPQPDDAKKQPDIKKPSPPVKIATPPPPPPEAVPLPKEEKKPEKKPDPKITPDPKKDDKKDKNKAKEDDLEAILKAVKDTAKNQPKVEKTEAPKDKEAGSPSKSHSNNYDPSQQMSLSEKDAIMSQIAKCWNPPAGAKNAQDLAILVEAEFGSDGSYIRAELSSESRARASADGFYRAAAEAALRAVKQCSPLKLPADKYDTWKNMELNFDPRFMLQ